MGLLRTILHQNGVMTDMFSTRAVHHLGRSARAHAGLRHADHERAQLHLPGGAIARPRFLKQLNPKGLVIAGGMHATVALDEMLAVPEFDKICQGPGENIIVDLVRHPEAFPRVVLGVGAKSRWPNGR